MVMFFVRFVLSLHKTIRVLRFYGRFFFVQPVSKARRRLYIPHGNGYMK